jgi:hypothetical protein
MRGYLVEMKMEIRETKEMRGLCAEGRSWPGLWLSLVLVKEEGRLQKEKRGRTATGRRRRV